MRPIGCKNKSVDDPFPMGMHSYIISNSSPETRYDHSQTCDGVPHSSLHERERERREREEREKRERREGKSLTIHDSTLGRGHEPRRE